MKATTGRNLLLLTTGIMLLVAVISGIQQLVFALETKDWPTYTNDEVGYSFQYPSDAAIRIGKGAGSNYDQVILHLVHSDNRSAPIYFYVFECFFSIPDYSGMLNS